MALSKLTKAAGNATEKTAEKVAAKEAKAVAKATEEATKAAVKNGRKLGKVTVGAKRIINKESKQRLEAGRFFEESGKANRQAAVREAWKQERKMVEETGRGTRPWTRQEKKELLENGKVKGYEGHHINNVKDHPELARNPDNIKFLKGRREHLDEHGGNFKNKTSGDLINRTEGGVDP